MAEWCRQDRCHIIEVHEEHDGDFVGMKPRGRPPTGRPRKPRTRAEMAAAVRPTITRVEDRPDGPFAYTQCPECHGGGCGECAHRGEMSLYRWHLWQRRCT